MMSALMNCSPWSPELAKGSWDILPDVAHPIE
jgi:hypothetical protein